MLNNNMRTSSDDKLKICEMYKNGHGVVSIAKALNRDRNTISRILKGFGIILKANPYKKTFTSDEMSDIHLRYSRGDSSTMISKDYGVTHKVILRVLNENKKVSRPVKRNDIKPDFVYDFNNPINVYLLGLWWADAHVHKNALLHGCKYEDGLTLVPTLNDFGIYTIYDKKIKTATGKDTHHLYYAINNVDICKFLMRYDYHIKSGASACKILEAIPENLQHLWWLGYLDGDGCISIKQKRPNNFETVVSFSSTYEQNWRFFHDTMKKLGINSYRINRLIVKNGRMSEVCVSGWENVKIFCDYIYQNYDKSLGFERKYSKYVEFLSNPPKKKTSRKLEYMIKYKSVYFTDREYQHLTK